jgi:hypothetical protein
VGHLLNSPFFGKSSAIQNRVSYHKNGGSTIGDITPNEGVLESNTMRDSYNRFKLSRTTQKILVALCFFVILTMPVIIYVESRDNARATIEIKDSIKRQNSLIEKMRTKRQR